MREACGAARSTTAPSTWPDPRHHDRWVVARGRRLSTRSITGSPPGFIPLNPEEVGYWLEHIQSRQSLCQPGYHRSNRAAPAVRRLEEIRGGRGRQGRRAGIIWWVWVPGVMPAAARCRHRDRWASPDSRIDGRQSTGTGSRRVERRRPPVGRRVGIAKGMYPTVRRAKPVPVSAGAGCHPVRR